MTKRFQDKVVLVTGAGSGIGAAAARRFAQEGAVVVVSDIHAQAAEAVAKELADQYGQAMGVALDVTDEAALQRLVDRTIAEFGHLDIMVNNAGIGESPTPLESRPSEDWHRVIATNLTSVFYGIKHAARVMKAQGRPGVIINTASILGVVAFSGAPAYTAAKHGVVGLTKAAALELAPAGIRVVALAPAFIKTPLIAGLEDAVLPLHPLGRLGESEEVANLIAFLASDEASFLTGATYLIDGGYTAQ